MKGKSIPIKRIIINYGIFLGLAIIAFSIISYLNGSYTKQGWIHLIILSVVTITSITAGLLIFKNRNNGYINLVEALKIGIGITVLGGLIATLWEILLIKVIDPEIITQLEDNQIKKIAETSKDFTLENMNEKIERTNERKSPSIMFTRALIEDLFVGFLLSLIIGLLIRKKRDPFK